MIRGEKAYEERELRDLGADSTAKFDRQFAPQRAALSLTFATKHGRLLAMTALIKETLFDLRQRRWTTHAELWNIALHINIAAHDLSVLVWQVVAERDIWARKLAARHVALMVSETAEDVVQLLGGPIRTSLNRLGVLDRYDADLRTIRRPLDMFRTKHDRELKDIRNVAAAHRDHDGLRMLGMIETADIEQTIDLGMEFSKILNEIGPLLQRILNETATTAPSEV